MTETDYLKFYDLERYLFEDVSRRFRDGEDLSAEDFFCIIIWKANRAKSLMASRLRSAKGHETLPAAVAALIAEIRTAPTNKEKLRVIMDQWGFRLPMASAVLSVLYPDDFTVYDVRVCQELGDFGGLQNRTAFESVWTGYEAFLEAVKANSPFHLSLRDKDRWLWGRSFANDLTSDVARQYEKVY